MYGARQAGLLGNLPVTHGGTLGNEELPDEGAEGPGEAELESLKETAGAQRKCTGFSMSALIGPGKHTSIHCSA